MSRYFWILLASGFAFGFDNHEAKDDAAELQVDGNFGFRNPQTPLDVGQPFSRGFGFTFLPIAKIADRDLVGYVEGSLLVREFRENGIPLNSKYLQSYGAGLGYQAINTSHHNGFAFGLFGINSDMRDLGSKDLYGDIAYLHQYRFSETLAFGGGLDLHFYVNTYLPYPVLYLDWKIAKHTKLKVNYDTGELKQFLSSHWSVSLGAQYDLYHYGMGKRDTYVMDALYGMARLEYSVSENVFLRLSGKIPVSGGETIETATGKQAIAGEGVSVRLQVAYGI